MSRPDSKTDGVRVFDADGNISEIRLIAGCMPDIVSALGQALSESNLPIYNFGGRLVELIEHHGNDQHLDRAKESLIIHPISPVRAMELAGLACSFQKWDARVKGEAGAHGAYVPTDCPRRVAEVYLERGHWPEHPRLDGFVEAPYLTAGADLVDTNGFEPKTGLYLKISQAVSGLNIPSRPTREKALAAVDILREHFSEFQFVSPADESAAVAGVLSVLQRRIFPAAPGFAVSASAPGTGKTTLCEALAIIATGRRPAVLSIGQDDAETEKRLVSVLLAGDASILLDNISEPVGGDLLCQILTSATIKVRPLGGSTAINIPSNASLFFTGNALSIKGDLKRRCLLIRMDAGLENPERRRFKRDILDHTYRNRGKLISAALTVVSAYLAAREPEIEGWTPYGSFSAWDRMVRRPLLWAGLPDPLGSAEALKDVDPDIEALRLMIDAWDQAFGPMNNPQKLSEVIHHSQTDKKGSAQLKDALNYICAEKITSRRLAGWLRRNRDRIIDGRRFVIANHDSVSKVAMWKLERC